MQSNLNLDRCTAFYLNRTSISDDKTDKQLKEKIGRVCDFLTQALKDTKFVTVCELIGLKHRNHFVIRDMNTYSTCTYVHVFVAYFLVLRNSGNAKNALGTKFTHLRDILKELDRSTRPRVAVCLDTSSAMAAGS